MSVASFWKLGMVPPFCLATTPRASAAAIALAKLRLDGRALCQRNGAGESAGRFHPACCSITNDRQTDQETG